MKSNSVILFTLTSLAAALPQHISKTNALLQSRQALSDPGFNTICSGVTSCALSKQEWDDFSLDDFLLFNIQSLGPGGNFPQKFADGNRAFDGPSDDLSGCASLDGPCDHRSGFSQSTVDNCPDLTSETVCAKYGDARAGIVIDNWVALHNGVKLQALAVAQARDNLVAQNFVSDLLDGMAEEQGSFLDEIVEFVVTLPLQLFKAPVLAVKLALKAFATLDNLTIDTIPDGGISPFIKQAVANQEIKDERDRAKDQMARQLDLIVEGEQQRLTFVLKSVFNGVSEQNIFTASDREQAARDTMVFKFAQSGGFLQGNGDMATLEELTAAAETTMKNTIVSAVMKVYKWQVIRVFGLVLNFPGEPVDPKTCIDGFKGLPDALGAPCLEFRRGGSISDPKMENPDVIQKAVDWPAMAQNADDCKGGEPDNSPNAEIGQDGLPRCFYNFPITTVDFS
ncbi:uncharacterized protein AB675_11915 [Cyphellophora attinorum]|uniref:Uncharacterized protein n=1 Tax=Cyphellophora attinorum TaxID=1664694 RepID=A0A0N1HH49_9EURO|nr:uncharacterized protein AB675_11915 [Phialophora attinorum]KPI34985.1 hypothetical protein AB675_11915 [Phialophora attinorum]